LSDVVRGMKRWPDCAELAYLWKTLPASPAAAKSTTFSPCEKQVYGAGKLFVDVGANIGSCTMQMLARPDVPEVVAFEPNPKNYFYLTGSVLKNQGFKERLALFPLALGQAAGSHPMYMQVGNAGNTVLDNAVGATEKQKVNARTTTLDEVFLESGKAPYIHLMKIDAQGFEVNILKGGSKLLASGAINAIHFELAPMWLLGEGTSPAELFTILVTNGYECYHSSGDAAENANLPPVLTHDELEHIACLENDVAPRDFFAVHNPTKVATTQEIKCPDTNPTKGANSQSSLEQR